jgi:SpoIIAA-like
VIERIGDLPAGVLGFRATDKITGDEYREMMKPIYATLEAGEKLNIYFELDDDFDGLDFGALWHDMRAAGSVGLKHRSSWQRMALVTEKDWIRHAAAVMGPLAPGELRVFDPHERARAKAWISEPVSRQS